MEDLFFDTKTANEQKLTETLDQESIAAIKDDIITALKKVDKKWKRKIKKKNKKIEKLEKNVKSIINQQLRQNAENYIKSNGRFEQEPVASTTERHGWRKMIMESVPKVLDIISTFIKRIFVPANRTLPPPSRYRDDKYGRFH